MLWKVTVLLSGNSIRMPASKKPPALTSLAKTAQSLLEKQRRSYTSHSSIWTHVIQIHNQCRIIKRTLYCLQFSAFGTFFFVHYIQLETGMKVSIKQTLISFPMFIVEQKPTRLFNFLPSFVYELHCWEWGFII